MVTATAVFFKEETKMNEKKQGIIWSYSPDKFLGTIIDDQDQRWFFHRSSIISGPRELTLDMKVLFRPDGNPALPGKLPVAREIEILTELGPAIQSALEVKL